MMLRKIVALITTVVLLIAVYPATAEAPDYEALLKEIQKLRAEIEALEEEQQKIVYSSEETQRSIVTWPDGSIRTMAVYEGDLWHYREGVDYEWINIDVYDSVYAVTNGLGVIAEPLLHEWEARDRQNVRQGGQREESLVRKFFDEARNGEIYPDCVRIGYADRGTATGFYPTIRVKRVIHFLNEEFNRLVIEGNYVAPKEVAPTKKEGKKTETGTTDIIVDNTKKPTATPTPGTKVTPTPDPNRPGMVVTGDFGPRSTPYGSHNNERETGSQGENGHNAERYD